MVPIHPVVLEKKFVLIGYPIWLPGTIIASDWLKFQRSSSPILHGMDGIENCHE
jgi:hypothetical protein